MKHLSVAPLCALHGLRARLVVTCAISGTLFLNPAGLCADTLEVTSLPAGYTSTSVELGVPFGGSLAVDPTNPNILYVSEGVGFSAPNILRVDIGANTVTPVATGFGNIGGIAVLADGSLAVTDNGGDETIYRLQDLDADDDFLDSGEVTELIAPILTNEFEGNPDFTGAQMTVAPAGNASNIPAGSLLVQTADGGTNAEILVVENPTSAPAFRPVGAAYFGGLAYNGGVAIDPAGNVIVGSSEFPSGRILALVNTNADEDIDVGESNEIVGAAGLPNSIADLAVTAEGRVLFSENSGNIKQFDLPANLLTGTATPAVFVQTNGGYISTVRLDVPANSFAPNSGPGGARLYIGGFVSFIAAATNLVVIEPASVSSVSEWQLY